MMQNETPEQEAERLNIEEESRKRLEKSFGLTPQAPSQSSAQATTPISSSMMRGDRVSVTLGASPTLDVTVGTLTLSLKPLKRKRIREFQNKMYEWPSVIQFAAAVRNPKCAGIDFEATAALCTQSAMSVYEVDEEQKAQYSVSSSTPYVPTPMPTAVTVQQVVSDVVILTANMDKYDDVINDTVWMMAKGMPNVVWPKTYEQGLKEESDEEGEDGEPIIVALPDKLPEGSVYLSDLLEEHLSIPDYVDLLRALKAANGGFAGDLTQRTF